MVTPCKTTYGVQTNPQAVAAGKAEACVDLDVDAEISFERNPTASGDQMYFLTPTRQRYVRVDEAVQFDQNTGEPIVPEGSNYIISYDEVGPYYLTTELDRYLVSTNDYRPLNATGDIHILVGPRFIFPIVTREKPIVGPGVDGQANTADDVEAGLDRQLGTADDVQVGADRQFGTADDVQAGPDGRFGTTDDIAAVQRVAQNNGPHKAEFVLGIKVGGSVRSGSYSALGIDVPNPSGVEGTVPQVDVENADQDEIVRNQFRLVEAGFSLELEGQFVHNVDTFSIYEKDAHGTVQDTGRKGHVQVGSIGWFVRADLGWASFAPYDNHGYFLTGSPWERGPSNKNIHLLSLSLAAGLKLPFGFQVGVGVSTPFDPNSYSQATFTNPDGSEDYRIAGYSGPRTAEHEPAPFYLQRMGPTGYLTFGIDLVEVGRFFGQLDQRARSRRFATQLAAASTP